MLAPVLTQSGICLNGLVVSDQGQRVGGASLTLQSLDERADILITADSAGRFVVTPCSEGWFQLVVSKPGYAPLAYGAIEPDGEGTPIVLRRGQQPKELTLTLQRMGVVAGVVRSIDGVPHGGVTVSVLTQSIDSYGRPYLRTVGLSTSTAEGRYRITALPPGSYRVMASPQSVPMSVEPSPESIRPRNRNALGGLSAEPVRGYVPTYYPSELFESDTAPIDLHSGQIRDGIDILLRAENLTNITGTASTDEGKLKVGYARLDSLNPSRPLVVDALVHDGAFSMPAVEHGSYLLTIDDKETERSFAVLLDLRPGQDSVEIAAVLTKKSTVRGTLSLGATGSAARLQQYRLVMYPVDQGFRKLARTAAASRSGEFMFTEIVEGRYRFELVRGPRLPNIAALVAGSGDGATSFLDVVSNTTRDNILVSAIDNSGRLTGVVTDGEGSLVTDVTIVAFPQDKSYWTGFGAVVAVRPSDTGEFRMSGLRPGKNRVAVIRNLRKHQWLLPGFLENLLDLSVEVSIEDGVTYRDLRLVAR